MFISKKKHKKLLDIVSNQRNMLMVLLKDTNCCFKHFLKGCISFETDKHILFLGLAEKDIKSIFSDQPLSFTQDNYDGDIVLALQYWNKECWHKEILRTKE